jgi:hypothetical protein
LDDFLGKSDDPYRDHIRALNAYDRRKEAFAERQEQTQRQRMTAFHERVAGVKEKYPDYEQVAFKPFHPAMVPYVQPGTAVGDFILEDDNGPDVLYHLQSHPEELDAILRTPPVTQVRRLTLLAQRFASPTPGAVGTNGATPQAPQVVVLPPKPPTPLRTEAQRVTPPEDGSLTVRQHLKAFRPRR